MDARKKYETNNGLDLNELSQIITTHVQHHHRLLVELEDVISDLKFLRSGGIIHFAVDFDLLFDFLHPYQRLLSSYRKHGQVSDEEKTRIVQQEAAMSFLFTGRNVPTTPILLPPHALELQNHLRNLSIHTYQGDLASSSATELERKLLTDEEREIFEVASKTFDSGRDVLDLPGDLRRHLMDIIFDKFDNLVLLLSGNTGSAVDRLHDLLSKERLELDSRLFTDHERVIEENVADRSMRFYLLFSKVRSGRVAANQADAEAVEMVVTLNEQLAKQDQPRERIFLLSDAPSMDMLFHMQRYPEVELPNIDIRGLDSAIHPFGPDVRLHRSSQVFLLFLSSISKPYVASEKIDWSPIIEDLEARKDQLLDFGVIDRLFKEIGTTVANRHKDMNKDERIKYSRIGEDLKRKNQFFTEQLTATILANRPTSLEMVLSQQLESLESSIKSVVTFLTRGDSGFSEEVARRRSQVDLAYRKQIETVSKRALDLVVASHEELVYRLKPGRRIPFEIRFRNEMIADKLKELDTLTSSPRKSRSAAHIRNLSKSILSLVGDPRVGTERKLLGGILNYNFNQLEFSVAMVASCLEETHLTDRQNYSLVHLLALHQFAVDKKKVVKYREARDLCQSEINRYHSDPRFEFMAGVILGRGIQSGLEDKSSIEEALRHFDRAISLTEGFGSREPLFAATIWNAKAFCYCLAQVQPKEGLEVAKRALRQMEELLPKKHWDANFLDTNGRILFREASFEGSVARKKELLTESKELLEKALELSKENRYLRYEREDIATALDRTNSELSWIVSRELE